MKRLPAMSLRGVPGLLVVAALAAASVASAALYVTGLRPGIETLAMAVVFGGGAALGWAERVRRSAAASEIEEQR